MEPAQPTRRLNKRRVACLLVLLVLVGVCVYVLLPGPAAGLQVTGRLSARDVAAIRQGVTHWRQRNVAHALTHLRFGMLWDELRVVRTCPLIAVASYDGQTAFAICRGKTWDGHQVSIAYTLTNAGAAWYGKTATRSERK